MAAGATGAITGANAHQQAGRNQRRGAGVDLHQGQRREGLVEQGRADQPQQECDAPGHVAPGPLEQAAKDAADAGDAPVKQYEQQRCHADQCAPGRRGPGCEMCPVDQHDVAPAGLPQ